MVRPDLSGATFNPGMEYNRIRAVIPKPCVRCSRTELQILQRTYKQSEEDYWVYRIPAYSSCRRCDYEQLNGSAKGRGSVTRKLFPKLTAWCCPIVEMVSVPIPASTVGIVERAVHAASVAEKGSEYRAHGTFIHHLSTLSCSEMDKQALCAWGPAAMGGYMHSHYGVTRMHSVAKPGKPGPPAQSRDEPSDPVPEVRKPPGLPDPMDVVDTYVGNPDVEGGAMLGTQLNGDEYGPEDRVTNCDVVEQLYGVPPKQVLARQIGPDLIPTEVMQSTKNNLKAGLAKRVKPLPFAPDKHMIRKINKTISVMIEEVFSSEKIKAWRVDNPEFCEMGSKKWSAQRFREAYHEAMVDTSARIEQEFQIKINEALPAKGKAPRPIIQTGDKGQMFMLLPVKCFETLLFKHFKDASIKGVDKHSAMQRVAQWLRCDSKNRKSQVIEGDGSAWDACCNAGIRGMTENRIIRHIIEVLGEDAEVPYGWMEKCADDMEKPKLKGKAKVKDARKSPMKVMIDSIRQSGHRGTSAFNWLINFVGWMCVLCKNPDRMIPKPQRKLENNYVSAHDGKKYWLRYAFEGDDSALNTTEVIDENLQNKIEEAWTSLGFRMKLVFVKDKMTFTGFDFLCDKNGPTQTFCPEIARNIASSAWTCSSLAKSNPEKVNEIGAAAMLARAENFKDCGPIARFFAELGLAHAKVAGDFEIGEDAALRLGIQPAQSVVERLHEASASAAPLSKQMRSLTELVGVGLTYEQEAKLLTCSFESPDEGTARQLIPKNLWDPGNFEQARR